MSHETARDFCSFCEPGGRGPACWDCVHKWGLCEDDCPLCAEIDATRCPRCNEPDWPYPGICDSCHDALLELDRTIAERIYMGWANTDTKGIFHGPFADLLNTLDLQMTWTLGMAMLAEWRRNGDPRG